MHRGAPPTIDDLLRHAGWVRRLAVRLAGPADGDDAVQEAYLAAMRSPPRHGANLRGFLAALVRNSLRLRARGDAHRTRREASSPRPTVAEAAAAAAERADLHRRLVTMVLELVEPHRTLVLRHYFDGADVASLAQQHRCSPDAVRAHLRRAREALRARLDAEPPSRSALAALATFAAGAPAVPASFSVLLAMKMKSTVAVAGIAVAALWLAWPAAAGPAGSDPTNGPAVAESVVAAPPASAAADPSQRVEAGERQPAQVAPPAVAGNAALRVRLRGLHADAPWTSPVRLLLEQVDAGTGELVRHESAGVPGADAMVALDAPPWLARARESSLVADDPRYLKVVLRPEQPFDTAQEVTVDVQVVAVFGGRVVDADLRPVAAARVTAYRIDGELPANEVLGETNTSVRGEFVLKAPPAQRLAITAVPMYAAAGDAGQQGEGSGVPDNGRVRTDLVPVWVVATGVVATTNAVGDLVLPRPARLCGVVRWADGPVMPDAYVNVFPTGSRTLLLGTGRGHFPVVVGADGSIAAAVSVRTDEQGAFEVAAPAGVRMALTAQPRSSGWNTFSNTKTYAAAPQHVEVVVARPVVLRVVRDGRAVPRATIQLEDAPGFRSIGVQTNLTDERGEMWLQLGKDDVVVTGIAGPHRSSPLTLHPDDAGKAIDVVLDRTLAEVRVDFAGEHAVHHTKLTWTRGNGQTSASEQLHRDSAGVPFTIHVEPGTWTLRAEPADGDRNSVFLVPVERTLDVPLAGADVTLPASFGGQLHVHATDGAGVHVAGTCRIVDRGGAERSPTFRVWTANRTWGTRTEAGELAAGGPNECEQILAAGEYGVILDFGARGARRENVTIVAREVTHLRVRL